jgi:hypothetical protein
MEKVYLGDSVYAELDPNSDGIVLTTDNGYPDDPRNKIVLEPQVLDALRNFVMRHVARRNALLKKQGFGPAALGRGKAT